MEARYIALALFVGCAACAGSSDAAEIDGGVTVDASSSDTGTSPDAAEIDGGVTVDAGSLVHGDVCRPLGHGCASASDCCRTMVTEAQATVTVETVSELISALAAATPGAIIWIPDTVSLDLTGHKGIEITAGVTLASSRNQGDSVGALLYNTENTLSPVGGPPETWHQFKVTGDRARITGIRLRGADATPGPGSCSTIPYPTGAAPSGWASWGSYCAYYADASHGIEVVDAADFILDNSEIFNWGYAGVRFNNAMEGHVYRNYIHHCRRYGLGYGVGTMRSSSMLIENNNFAYTRHAIAGDGYKMLRYEAKYNTVENNPSGYFFDMHGDFEGGSDPVAGSVIRVHRNTFRGSTRNYAAVCIRGIPSIGAWVTRNCVQSATLGLDNCTNGAAFGQRYHRGGTYVLANNTLNTTTGVCDAYGAEIQPEFKISISGTSPWTHLARYTFDTNEIALGDFDGDGKTDVFRATGHRWYFSPRASGRWIPLATSATSVDNLAFGDFDGDGKTDVFAINATGRWQFSSGGVDPWTDLASDSASSIANTAVADFDGDGISDVFRATGSAWLVSYGGTRPYVQVASSTLRTQDLLFGGDFDGDGRDDVFHANGSAFTYVPGGPAGTWGSAVTITPSARTAVRLGDFDGDGKSDVFYTSGSQWQFFSSASSAWVDLTGATCGIEKLLIGDFAGDEKSDVFGPRCSER